MKRHQRIGKQLATGFVLAGIVMFAGFLFIEFAPPAMANDILRMVANVIGGITGL